MFDLIFISLKRRRFLGSEPIISSVIIFTSPVSVILGESASSSLPSPSSVAAASRIGVDHFFRHHLHFSSVGVVHPRRVGVIISAVTQIRCCGNQRNPPSNRKGIKGNAAKIHFGCKGIRLFRLSKQLELEISLTLAAKESFQSLVNADSASCNNQASDTFALPVSTVQREIQNVQDRLPNQVLILPEHLDFAASSL
ncbi:hypothetical protein Bca52824_000465 [Brassica carinata]|uniref:Uncharacterized protein n=1 Tax=Brassica carinata TaxID=52824 RepID=A0A8X7WHG2_BRACI|nr:hypothetical protein Bca52824_000465 [Brassica carinata]